MTARRPGRELGAQAVHVRDAAQVVHAGEFGARQRQQARMAARGQQQSVVFDGAAIGDLDAPPRPIDAHRRKTQSQVDAMVGVVGRVPDEQAIAIQRSGQVLLRQRRTLIGQRGFIADQRDRALVTALVQGLDRLRCSLSSADYRYSLIVHCVHTI